MSPSAITDLDAHCSRHFRWRDIVECGETWHRLATLPNAVANLPHHLETWAAIRQLAATILDPLVDQFGPMALTYGFAAPELYRHIGAKIAPKLDQHAGCELRQSGAPICPRRGQACDLRVLDTSSRVVAAYVVQHLPFDRLYYYGPERPLHVSVGPENTRYACEMKPGPSGRLIPRRLVHDVAIGPTDGHT